MKRKEVFAILVAVALFTSINVHSGGVTKLSQKAAMLTMGMSKQQVVDLLGPPTWVITLSDKGDFVLPRGISLNLLWQNTNCAPVAVDFDMQGNVIGWDEGRAICGEGIEALEPPDGYRCSNGSRGKYCK